MDAAGAVGASLQLEGMLGTGISEFKDRGPRHVSGCSNSYLNDRNSIELEPGRCRRTDGTKWRYKSAVVPGQKYYCAATYMHRGAKRHFAENEAATTNSAVSIARLPNSTATTNIQKAYCSITSASLCMSIPASAPLIKSSEKSPSSSDTDTINEYSYASF